MKFLRRLLLPVFLCLLAGSSVSADTSLFDDPPPEISLPAPYGGLSLSFGAWKTTPFGSTTERFSGGTRLPGAFAGLRLHEHWALEFDWAHVTRLDVDRSETSDHPSHVSGWTAGAHALGFLPLGPTSDLYARAGVHTWSLDTDRDSAGDSHESDRGAGLVFGLGLQSLAWSRFTLGFEYQARHFGVDEGRDTLSPIGWLQTVQARVSFH